MSKSLTIQEQKSVAIKKPENPFVFNDTDLAIVKKEIKSLEVEQQDFAFEKVNEDEITEFTTVSSSGIVLKMWGPQHEYWPSADSIPCFSDCD